VWRAAVPPGRLTTVTVRADHVGLLAPPAVDDLVARIGPLLDNDSPAP
jgi:hypothetical protein